MNQKIIVFFLIFIFLSVLTIFYLKKTTGIESFYVTPRVTTWTPYIIDWMRQPGYSNYFYHNGYMYPIY
jgi:hypothetical protein